jgi:hypothetical protein
MASEAAITIRRPSHRLVDRPMSYTVWIDGEDVGAVHDRETQRFPVAPGVHHVRLGISGRARKRTDLDQPGGRGGHEGGCGSASRVLAQATAGHLPAASPP